MHPPPRRTQREASSSSGKQKAASHIGSKDLVSLPNEIIEEIFNLLEFKQLVQCGIVAKPFRVTYDILFEIQTLKVLRLVSVYLGSPTKDFHVTGFRLLKVCSMKQLTVKVVILDTLLTNCTELEILEIIQCYTPDHLRFSARNLNKFKKLRLIGCILLKKITLDTPSLTTLHYSGQIISFIFENCGNIVDFMLNLMSTGWPNFNANHFLVDKLMLTLPKIEVMTTTAELPKAGMMDRFYYIPTVKEVNLTLKGSMDWNLFRIAYFLSKFPCCERLFIDVRGWIPDIESTLSQLFVQLSPPVQWTAEQTARANRALAPSYPHLELLKVTGFRFEPNEMELLYYFLSTGHNLKTVAIFLASPRHCTSIAPNEAVFNDSLRPLITSPNLWVNIYQNNQKNELYPAKHPMKWYKVDS
ncbi:FBD-associated F-box protein At1g61320 [Linum grandiflorum]